MLLGESCPAKVDASAGAVKLRRAWLGEAGGPRRNTNCSRIIGRSDARCKSKYLCIKSLPSLATRRARRLTKGASLSTKVSYTAALFPTSMFSKTLLSALALTAVVDAIPKGGPLSYNTQPGSKQSIRNMKEHIKNVLVLVMENRSLDNLLGGQTIKGLENPINNGPFCNPLNVTHPEQGYACSGASDYNEILDDPDHAIYGNNIEFYGTFTPDNDAIASGKLQPSMNGFCDEQIRLYNAKENRSVLAQQVMHYYTEEQVPLLTALTNNFVVMNNWHSDIPGVSSSALDVDGFTQMLTTF